MVAGLLTTFLLFGYIGCLCLVVSFYYFGIVLVFCFDLFTVGKEGFFVPCWVGLYFLCSFCISVCFFWEFSPFYIYFPFETLGQINKKVLGQSVNTRNPNKLNPESLEYNKTLKSPVVSESVGRILRLCCREDGEGTSRRACQVLFVSSYTCSFDPFLFCNWFCLYFHHHHYRICVWCFVIINLFSYSYC